jgi:hypothetical protein
MTTAATSMTTMRPGDLDELESEIGVHLGSSQMQVTRMLGRGTRVSVLTPSRGSARVRPGTLAKGSPR